MRERGEEREGGRVVGGRGKATSYDQRRNRTGKEEYYVTFQSILGGAIICHILIPREEVVAREYRVDDLARVEVQLDQEVLVCQYLKCQRVWGGMFHRHGRREKCWAAVASHFVWPFESCSGILVNIVLLYFLILKSFITYCDSIT